jgi:hypothetical protein
MNMHDNIPADITDSKHDQERLQPEETTLNLPDVKDIPGQENIQIPHIKEMADTTISSADEEADYLFDEDETDDDYDVTEEEKILLDKTDESMSTPEDEDVFNAALDDMDEDGELLNESIDTTGEDLDVPGSEDDDADEETGEEDEENNNYSLGDNK